MRVPVAAPPPETIEWLTIVASAATAIRPASRERQIRRVLWIVLALNVTVALAKFFYGLATASSAMQADGIHSLFDGASNVIALIGMWFAARPADKGHPYGHGKFETFTAAAIALLLGIACYNVARSAVESLQGQAETQVTAISFAIMLGTLAVNLGVTTWEAREGRRLGSEVLLADSRHTLSDVLVSSGVIVSLVLVELGIEKADGIVAMLVAIAIAYTAVSILRGVARTLGDAARLPAEEVCAVVASVEGVIDCHDVRSRGSDNRVFVDLHITVAPDLSVDRGCEIVQAAEAALREHFAQVVDIVVHVDPAGSRPEQTTSPA